MRRPLVADRSFLSLLVSQFLGAFNDNAYRQFILLISLGISLGWLGDDAQALAMAVFTVPFIAFSLFAGSLADRLSKRRVIVAMNVAEIAVMALGMGAFALHALLAPESTASGEAAEAQRATALTVAIVASLVVLFLMGTQSALFGPSKYGAIPELVPDDRLSAANGLVNMTTNVAIVLGTMTAAFINRTLIENDLPRYTSGYFFVAVATVGWLCSLGIRKLPAADPGRKLELNIAAVPVHLWRELRRIEPDRTLFGALLANSWFFLVGALALPVFNVYGQEILGYEHEGGSSLFTAVALGIAVGSPLASLLSGRRVELGLVPVAAAGMAGGFATLALTRDPGIAHGGAFAAGVFGGLYVVPLAALLQQRPDATEKGKVMGVLEATNFIFIAASALLYFLLRNLFGLGPAALTVALGVLTVTGTALIFARSPVFLQRCILLFAHKIFYRIRVLHPERVPAEGGALLVCNHVSFADPVLLSAASPRIPRFIMHRGFLDVPFVGAFARTMRVIPVAENDGPRALLRSLDAAAEHAARGEVTCIFAEGSISRTGNMLPFSKGLERIAHKAGVPVVPVYLDRVWGSLFSFHKGRFFWKRPHRIPYRVTVAFGEPLPPDTPAHVVRSAVQRLGAVALDSRRAAGETLATRFLRRARRRPRRAMLADSSGKSLTGRQVLTAVLLLRALLRERVRGQSHVGVMLPPSIGGALVNLALATLGVVSVNLNFTIGDEALESAVEQCSLRTVIGSRKFLERIGREPDERFLDLEPLIASARPAAKLRAALLAWLPARVLQRLPGVPLDPDEDVTVIFSSGSTGVPKGVRLSHHNILSNVRSLAQVFDPSPRDCILGVLPFFHSFGYTATVWLPVCTGFRVVYHPDPRDARTIGRLLREHGVTILISTPTFYQLYLRRLEREDISSVRLAVSGAEKLKSSLRMAWQEKFGSSILEGYGCTELSPAVSMNLPDVERDGVRQCGHKPGTIGHPFPGVAVRVVDLETGTDVEPDEEGMLLVFGPSVMKGYLGRDDLTAEVIRDGWYVTGDLATVDGDGFVTITGRVSRFSKIGGEMVPHLRVEEAVQAIIDGAATHCDPAVPGSCPEAAVTAVSCDDKGERLIVLHTPLEITVDELVARLQQGSLPKLWIPRRDAFVEVEELPKLGSGKLDLAALGRLAHDLLPRRC